MNESSTAERLKWIMHERGLKQVDVLHLAKPYQEKYHITLSKSSLNQYLSGYAKPGPLKLFVLGEILNVSEAWLMGYNVPMERKSDDTPPPGYPKIATLARSSVDMQGLDSEIFDKWAVNGIKIFMEGDSPTAKQPNALIQKIFQLDEIDRGKVDGFVSGLLAAEKYREPTQPVKFAARAGGGIREVPLTESQIETLKNLPEVTSLDDKKDKK